jgi:two-component system catabolic regulation response regulator CreB
VRAQLWHTSAMALRILVVEDERAVADTLVYALRTEGYEPLWAETGASARAALRSGEVALVILDVGLPDVSGFELCQEIRRERDVPIIFLTARCEEIDRIVGLEIGADDYLPKPFSPRELTARVRAVLRRARATAAPAVATADLPFVVDEARLVVAYFGRQLELTRTEYRLLELLIRHPGWVYTREQLLQSVWDDAGASTERTVDSHVKSLRAKLRAVRPEIEAIETRRGTGYALRERW